MVTLYLLPATEEARVICEQYDELEEKPPSPSTSPTTDRRSFVFLALALVLVVVDAAIDLYSYINSSYMEVFGGHQRLISFLCALILTGIPIILSKVPTSTESQESRIRQRYHELCQCGDIVEVHYKLIRRWSKIRHEVGIDTTEPRAYLEEFPEVVRQIVELRKAIKSLSGKAARAELQPALSDRITQIMREALEPLAVELVIARSLEALGQEMVHEADEEVARQRQLTHAAATELRARHLLRVT